MSICFAPVKECLHPEWTYGEICVRCGEHGRFGREQKSEFWIMLQYYPSIPALWYPPERFAYYLDGKWCRNDKIFKYEAGELSEILPPHWQGNESSVRWWIEGRVW